MDSDERVLFARQSDFNRIVVSEDAFGLRTLRFGDEGAYQSVVKADDPTYMELEYTRAMPLCLAFAPHPRRILVLGLGGGSVPRFFHHYFPSTNIDVVEIDSMVLEVARAYCGFEEDERLRVHVEDGRDFIERHEHRYDMIVLDTFDSEAIPGHLRTAEFLEEVRAALTEEGVAVANVWGRKLNRLYDDMLRTYREVFDDVYVFDVPGPGTKIFAALPREQRMSRSELRDRLRAIFTERGFNYDFTDAFRGFYHADVERTTGGNVIRD